LSGVQSVGFVALNVSLTATANFRRDQSKPGMPCVPVFAAVHESGHGTKLPIAALHITADIEGRTDMSRTSRDGRV